MLTSVLGSAEVWDGQRAVAGACELCVSREELRGTLPAALPKGSLAAEQEGRTQLWICSRAS